MKLNNRQLSILSIIQREKFCSVKQFSESLFFSPSTIRRDLNILENENLIYRTHGGAMLLEGRDNEIPLALREGSNRAIKSLIAEKAAEFVNSGDSIIMDSSTTVSHMVPYLLGKKDLTIVTNGSKTAIDLGATHNFTVICTGGLLRENSLSYVGVHAKNALSNLHVDKLFFSSRAVDVKCGITDISDVEAELRRTMLGQCAKSFFLAESNKIGKVALNSVCSIGAINVFITDSDFHPTDVWKNIGVSIVQVQV